jgi:hypothetical protein
MANDEHVAMLKKGVRAWNEWRDENPNVVTWRSEDTNVPYYPGPVLDLTNAHLPRANLPARRHTHHYRDASFASSAAIFMAHPQTKSSHPACKTSGSSNQFLVGRSRIQPS